MCLFISSFVIENHKIVDQSWPLLLKSKPPVIATLMLPNDYKHTNCQQIEILDFTATEEINILIPTNLH